MRHYLLSLTILLFTYGTSNSQPKPANGRANENYIWIYHGKKLQKVFPIGTVRTELINGKFNISATCGEQGVFEINGLNEVLLKDTSMVNPMADLVYIRGGKGGVWKNKVHRLNGLSISCATNNPGAPIRVWVKGMLIKGKEKRLVEVQFNGRIPEKQFLKTDTH